jgi:hypothetical protein
MILAMGRWFVVPVRCPPPPIFEASPKGHLTILQIHTTSGERHVQVLELGGNRTTPIAKYASGTHPPPAKPPCCTTATASMCTIILSLTPITGLPLRITLTKGGDIIYWLAATHDTRYSSAPLAIPSTVPCIVCTRAPSWHYLYQAPPGDLHLSPRFLSCSFSPRRASDLSHAVGEVRNLGVGWDHVLRGLQYARICCYLAHAHAHLTSCSPWFFIILFRHRG